MIVMFIVYYSQCLGADVHKHCLLSAHFPAHNVAVVVIV